MEGYDFDDDFDNVILDTTPTSVSKARSNPTSNKQEVFLPSTAFTISASKGNNDPTNLVQKTDKKNPQNGQNSGNNKNHPEIMNIGQKPGMQDIDRDRINNIIHEASRGSLFFKRQAERQQQIHRSIEGILQKVLETRPEQLESSLSETDAMVAYLEKSRVMNRIIAHFDLDMFFAAVEIRDKPELADKPMAVGSNSMIATSNYVARKFGVRAAMPGFIAKKLCPELILIPPNGSKYREASAEIFSVLEQYDPELASMSLDEAYLDLTEYVRSTLERDNCEAIHENYDGTLPQIWWDRANQIVGEIRQAIYDKTQLRCSAGISCNTMLAKIATDVNKPNGQFIVRGYRQDIMEYIKSLSIEKVSGIGKVSAQYLHALDIKTCQDLYDKRHLLPIVFSNLNVRFYLKVSLGMGSTCIQSDEQRKSKSVEHTFPAIRDQGLLIDKLNSICDELCTKFLRPYRIKGRTVTLKLKRNTFTTSVRSYTMLFSTNDKEVIFTATKNLLITEIANAPPDVSFRLMGVKISNLIDTNTNETQLTIDTMFKRREMTSKPAQNINSCIDLNDVNIVDPDSNVLEPFKDIDEDSIQNYIIPSNDTEGADSTDTNLINENKSDKISRLGDENPDLNNENASLSVKNCSFIDATNGSQKRTLHESLSEDQEILISSNSSSASTSYQNFDKQEGIEKSLHSEHNRNTSINFNAGDDEDFQCPYCFKSFTEFFDLESHVECNCVKKVGTSLIELHYRSQKSNSGAGSSTAPITNSPQTLKQRNHKSKNSPSSTQTKRTNKPNLAMTQTIDIDLVSQQSKDLYPMTQLKLDIYMQKKPKNS